MLSGGVNFIGGMSNWLFPISKLACFMCAKEAAAFRAALEWLASPWRLFFFFDDFWDMFVRLRRRIWLAVFLVPLGMFELLLIELLRTTKLVGVGDLTSPDMFRALICLGSRCQDFISFRFLSTSFGFRIALLGLILVDYLLTLSLEFELGIFQQLYNKLI